MIELARKYIIMMTHAFWVLFIFFLKITTVSLEHM